MRWAKEAAVLAEELGTTVVSLVLHWDHRKVFPSGLSTEVYTAAIEVGQPTRPCHCHPCNTGFEGMQQVIRGLRLGTLGQCWNFCREALKGRW